MCCCTDSSLAEAFGVIGSSGGGEYPNGLRIGRLPWSKKQDYKQERTNAAWSVQIPEATKADSSTTAVLATGSGEDVFTRVSQDGETLWVWAYSYTTVDFVQEHKSTWSRIDISDPGNPVFLSSDFAEHDGAGSAYIVGHSIEAPIFNDRGPALRACFGDSWFVFCPPDGSGDPDEPPEVRWHDPPNFDYHEDNYVNAPTPIDADETWDILGISRTWPAQVVLRRTEVTENTYASNDYTEEMVVEFGYIDLGSTVPASAPLTLDRADFSAVLTLTYTNGETAATPEALSAGAKINTISATPELHDFDNAACWSIFGPASMTVYEDTDTTGDPTWQFHYDWGTENTNSLKSTNQTNCYDRVWDAGDGYCLAFDIGGYSTATDHNPDLTYFAAAYKVDMSSGVVSYTYPGIVNLDGVSFGGVPNHSDSRVRFVQASDGTRVHITNQPLYRLEVVYADADDWQIGPPSRNGSAGYDVWTAIQFPWEVDPSSGNFFSLPPYAVDGNSADAIDDWHKPAGLTHRVVGLQDLPSLSGDPMVPSNEYVRTERRPQGQAERIGYDTDQSADQFLSFDIPADVQTGDVAVLVVGTLDRTATTAIAGDQSSGFSSGPSVIDFASGIATAQLAELPRGSAGKTLSVELNASGPCAGALIVYRGVAPTSSSQARSTDTDAGGSITLAVDTTYANSFAVLGAIAAGSGGTWTADGGADEVLLDLDGDASPDGTAPNELHMIVAELATPRGQDYGDRVFTHSDASQALGVSIALTSVKGEL